MAPFIYNSGKSKTIGTGNHLGLPGVEGRRGPALKGYEKTFRGYGNVLHHDYSNGFKTICIPQDF